MATPSFYNENARRSYPFRKGQEFMPHSAVVDAGFLLGPGSGYIDGTHAVELYAVVRNGSHLFFLFRCTAPGLEDWPLVFTRAIDAEAYASEYADTASPAEVLGSMSESIDVGGDCTQAEWSGFLVTGPLAELLELLPGDGTLSGTAEIEPALVRCLDGTQLRSVNLVNQDRTRYTAPPGCAGGGSTGFTPAFYHVRATCLLGAIRFQEGYNCSLRQDAGDNTITIEAAVGAGEGEPTGEVPVYHGETAPAGTAKLDGSPGCGNVIRTINGVGGQLVKLRGGMGVTVTPQADDNKLQIAVDSHGMGVCD